MLQIARVGDALAVLVHEHRIDDRVEIGIAVLVFLERTQIDGDAAQLSFGQVVNDEAFCPWLLPWISSPSRLASAMA